MRLPKQLSEVTKKMTRPFWRNLKKPNSFQILENNVFFGYISKENYFYFEWLSMWMDGWTVLD